MPTRPYRRGRSLTTAAIVVALVLHGAVLGSVKAFGLSGRSDGAAGTAAQVPDESVLSTSCSGDVLLVTASRAAMCLAPWSASDLSQCGDDARMAMWMDLSACQNTDDALAAAPVQLITPRAAAKLTPIDPEPLLEEMKQQVEEQQKKLAELQPKPPQPPPPPPPPPAARPAQVVEVVKPAQEVEPENARLLAEHSVAVDKQKVARGSAREPLAARSKPEELMAKQDPKEASMKELPDQDRGQNSKAPPVPGKLSMRNPGLSDPSTAPQEAQQRGTQTGERGPATVDGLDPRFGDNAMEQQRRERGEVARGQNGGGGGAPQVPNLRPTAETLERALGGGSVDHLEDVEEGDETALNAKRWVYASFFNRMKRSVAQNWDPGTVWRRADPSGTTYGGKTRVTEVRVSLSPRGELTKIVVTGPSGVTDLDEEAVRSFHAAQPFPNPPEGLVKDGQITFAFSFFFEIGSPRSQWRVIRSM